jgi:hypothetical protein
LAEFKSHDIYVYFCFRNEAKTKLAGKPPVRAYNYALTNENVRLNRNERLEICADVVAQL